jgi:pyrroline-5-carboxylate reductase
MKGFVKGQQGGGSNAKIPVSVIGAGAFAQGICSSAVRSGAIMKFDICMASRKVGSDNPVYLDCLPEVPVLSIDQAVKRATLLIVALPARALLSFVDKHREDLDGKVSSASGRFAKRLGSARLTLRVLYMVFVT